MKASPFPPPPPIAAEVERYKERGCNRSSTVLGITLLVLMYGRNALCVCIEVVRGGIGGEGGRGVGMEDVEEVVIAPKYGEEGEGEEDCGDRSGRGGGDVEGDDESDGDSADEGRDDEVKAGEESEIKNERGCLHDDKTTTNNNDKRDGMGCKAKTKTRSTKTNYE